MAKRLTLALPGDINTLTGGYIYDKRAAAALTRDGWDVEIISLDAQFPAVDEAVKQRSASFLANVPGDRALIVDGLALGAFGQAVHRLSDKRPFIALVHHPLSFESGLDKTTAKALQISETIALSVARKVIVTSPTTRIALIDHFGVAPQDITVIEPGVDQPSVVPQRTNRNAASPTKLLSVGAIVPRKGFDVMVRALATVTDLNWTLDLVGDDQRSADTVKHVKSLIIKHGLTERVHLAGAQPTQMLESFYRQADVFVLASHYEGYGMAYAEALAWGLPVIGTDGGAAAATLHTPAACVVPVNDVTELAAALRQVISDPWRRSTMQAAAHLYAKTLPTWQTVGTRLAQTINETNTP